MRHSLSSWLQAQGARAPCAQSDYDLHDSELNFFHISVPCAVPVQFNNESRWHLLQDSNVPLAFNLYRRYCSCKHDESQWYNSSNSVPVFPRTSIVLHASNYSLEMMPISVTF